METETSEQRHLRHSVRRLVDVQKGLQKAGTEDLLLETIALKERVIRRYEALGGAWPERSTS